MLANKPPMGFNTWNTFGERISDEMIRETADAMVSFGLRDAGYEYLVIDDCWSEKERDAVTGKIVPDKNKFPNGMNAVSDYVHSKGLKFGMYSCAGTRTCADYPGSFAHEYLDAKTFAEYGCDFLKYDFCYKPETANGPLLYRRMGLALRSCGREILFSACNWGSDEVHDWIRSAGAQMYRSTGDIGNSFRSCTDIAASQVEKLACSAPGCFNDLDMLTVGMYGERNISGDDDVTDEQREIDYKTQFALWCMYSSPLMLGCDVRKIDETTLKLVTNKTLLRINQDEEARPAFIATSKTNSTPTFVKLLSDGQIAVMFSNLGDNQSSRCALYFEDIGITAASGYGLHMINAFTGEDIGVKKEFMMTALPAHDCVVYICTLEK